MWSTDLLFGGFMSRRVMCSWWGVSLAVRWSLSGTDWHRKVYKNCNCIVVKRISNLWISLPNLGSTSVVCLSSTCGSRLLRRRPTIRLMFEGWRWLILVWGSRLRWTENIPTTLVVLINLKLIRVCWSCGWTNRHEKNQVLRVVVTWRRTSPLERLILGLIVRRFRRCLQSRIGFCQFGPRLLTILNC